MTAYASSLDVIGLLTKDIDLLETAFDTMAGPDENDQSSLSREAPATRRRCAAVLELDDAAVDSSIARAHAEAVNALAEASYTVSRVRLPSLDLVAPSYYTIATAEASANLARYNGIRYGSSSGIRRKPGGTHAQDAS